MDIFPRKVRKAVFPVAGLGTRFLPATKSIPKEMLPIVDKPLIQYAVEEALEAGIETLIFITSNKKHAISDHFDSDFELETKLTRSGKHDLLEHVLSSDDFRSAIVFTRTKHRAKRLAQKLDRSGHRAVALQGNMSQKQRERAMAGFRRKQFDVLVATDIAARGIF